MNVGAISFKKNTALIAIIIIDIMFLVWSCENESGKIAKQHDNKNRKEIASVMASPENLI